MFNQYQLKLTPTMINPATEGSMDSVIVNGSSVQRTGYLDIVDELNNRKIIEVNDGQLFNDNVTTLLNDVIPTYAFTVVDKSNDGLTKKVAVAIKNTSGGGDAHVLLWQNFSIINNQRVGFNFAGNYQLLVNINHMNLPRIDVVNGKVYSLNASNTAAIASDTTVGNQFVFKNNSTSSVVVTVIKNNNAIERWTLATTATQAFSYVPTFFIAASANLVTPIAISDMNTEISTLGLLSSDIEITLSGVYVFNLTHYVFA